jgi:ABC-type transport system involved in multi-copper enzyme maturation permease subunit
MSSIFTIAALTFREAARRRILLAGFVLGVIFLVIYGLGVHYIIQEALVDAPKAGRTLLSSQLSNFFLIAGLYVVNTLTGMMVVLTSVDTLSGEISSGLMHTIISKPLRRWEVVMGKWLGFVGLFTLYLLLMGGGAMGLVYAQSGYISPNPLAGLALMWLNAAILLSVSLLGGAIFSTLANGVLVFGLFGVAFIGGWIEQIGSFIPNAASSQTAVNIGVVTSLLMPVDALWRRASYEIQSGVMSAMGFGPFTAGSHPSNVMLVYAGLYLVVVLGLAMVKFSRRDI